MPQEWGKAIIKVLFKKTGPHECGKYRDIVLEARAGKEVLEVAAIRLSTCYESKEILPGVSAVSDPVGSQST